MIGHGLNAIRTSSILEQIDLSLAKKYEDPFMVMMPKISHEVVLPILDSIISIDGCVLKHIQFPYTWQIITATSEAGRIIDEFRNRYNQSLDSRMLSCSGWCDEILVGVEWLSNRYRRQHNLCYDCLRPFCWDCVNGDILSCCKSSCIKYYCEVCSTVVECQSCGGHWCRGCNSGDMIGCDGCQQPTCESCLKTCDCCNRTRCQSCAPYIMCSSDGCFKGHFDECFDANTKNTMSNTVRIVNNITALAVELLHARQNGAFPVVVAENTQKDKEIDKLCKEIEELKMKLEYKS